MKTENPIKQLHHLFEKIILRGSNFSLYGFSGFCKEILHNMNVFIIEQLPKRINEELTPFETSYRNRILQEIYEFFSLLYPKGILSVSNYLKQEETLEKITFQWEYEFQYYYKFNSITPIYSCKCDDYEVECKIIYVQPENGGKNKPKRFYLLSNESNSIFFENKGKIKKIFLKFEYRTLDWTEKKNFHRNIQTAIIEKIKIQIIEKLGEDYPKNASIERSIEDFIFNQSTEMIFYPNLSEILQRELSQYISTYFIPKYIKIMPKNETLSKLTGMTQSFKFICNLLIAKLFQIENIFIKFFNKKKFVFKSDFIADIGRISEKYWDTIIQNEFMQVNWMSTLNFDSNSCNILTRDRDFLQKKLNLYIDTKFLSESFKNELLSDLSEIAKKSSKKINFNGYLFKGDNWQVLNLLTKKLANQIKLIYIDPPYNTGTQDFIYNDHFQKAFWLTMMENRLSLAKNLLKENGIFFSSIDDNELPNYSLLVEKIFPVRMENIIWHKKTQPSYLSKELIPVTEYIIIAKKIADRIPLMGEFGDQQKLTELINIGNMVCERIISKNHILIQNQWDGILQNKIYGKGKLQVELLNGPIEVLSGIPSKDLQLRSRFKWSQERINNELEIGGQIFIKNIKSLRPTILRHYDEPIIKAPTTLLSKKVNQMATNTDANKELKNFFDISPFDYSKPTQLIKYLVRAATYFEQGPVLDFFAGSGTTAQAVIELNDEEQLNRPIYLIERDSHFNSVLLPRLEKLIYSKLWKDGQSQSTEGYNLLFQYFHIEEFEDIFYNYCCFQSEFEKKLGNLQYQIDWNNQGNPIMLNIQNFTKPFDYEMNFNQDGILTTTKVDLVETFNFLLGIEVDEYIYKKINLKPYRIIIGTISEENSFQKYLIVWRTIEDIDLENEVMQIKQLNINFEDFDKIFMNAEVTVPNGHLIEPLFHELMFP